MKKIIFTIVFALLICHVASALDMDMCGIQIGEKLTKEQVIAKFGKPTSYKLDKSYGYTDNKGYEKTGTCEYYEYDGVKFDITCDCGFEFFAIYSKDFPIMTKKVDAGGIRVSHERSDWKDGR